jgi:hypothetical protein
VQERLGFIIYVRVLGEAREALTLGSVTVPSFAESPPIALEARFQNEGTVHEAPVGTIEVRDMLGWIVATATLPVRNVLPGAIRKVVAPVGGDGGVQESLRQQIGLPVGGKISGAFQGPPPPGYEHPIAALLRTRSEQPFALQPHPRLHQRAAKLGVAFPRILLDRVRQTEVVTVQV